MAKCMIEHCTREAHYNHITRKTNIVCFKHLEDIKKFDSTDIKPYKKQISHTKGKLTGGPNDKRKEKKDKPQFLKGPELFVLRGHTLTINYTGKTKHVNVDRLSRAVKYNADKEGTSGKTFHYVIDIKQGIDVIANILFDNKSERDREFEKLQSMLSKL
jgi:hypothetical protein